MVTDQPSEPVRTARCACQQASITVSGAPLTHGICHCSHCKRRTGSAFGMSSYFARAAVQSIEGDTHVYALGATGREQQRHFCPRCGTTLFWFLAAEPDRIGIASGCFEEPGLTEPSYSATDRLRSAWLTLPSHWRRHAD